MVVAPDRVHHTAALKEEGRMANENVALLQEALASLREYRRAVVRSAKDLEQAYPADLPGQGWAGRLRNLVHVQQEIEAVKQAIEDENVSAAAV